MIFIPDYCQAGWTSNISEIQKFAEELPKLFGKMKSRRTTMARFFKAKLTLSLGLIAVSIACENKKLDQTTTTTLPNSATSNRHLYVASGTCYSGVGLTTFTATTASNQVFKIDSVTGQLKQIIADYYAAPAAAGDSPVGIVEWENDQLLILVQNGTSGRIEKVSKEGGTRSNFGLTPGPATTLATAPRGMIKTSDGGLLIMRTGFIEKVNSSGVRQTQGATPWVNSNLGVTCGAANTLITSVSTSNTNRIIATHSAASPANRIISVPASGANGSCSSATASPQTTAFPVASVFDKTNAKVLIAYAGANTNNDINSIYAFDFNETTGALSNPQEIYDSNGYPGTYSYLLFGISSMHLDSTTQELYVATTISTATTVVNYAIEKFNYDATKIGTNNTAVLTREGIIPFYNYSIDTKCISSMFVEE